MKFKKYKLMIKDLFFSLLCITIFVSLYNHFNFYYFLNIQIKLIIVTLILGVSYLILWRGIKIKFTKIKVVLFIILLILYILFLNWVFSNLILDEFLFFVILLYIPLSKLIELEIRVSILIAILLLVTSLIILLLDFKDYANSISISAYYFLIVGTLLLIEQNMRFK